MPGSFPAFAALATLCTLLLAFVRVFRGPTAEDRLLGIQSFGTVGTAVVVMLSLEGDRAGFPDVAMLLSMLAAVTIITFTRILPRPDEIAEQDAASEPESEGEDVT